MGQKDLAEKQLEAFPDIAADIINATCYGGRNIVQEENLEFQPTVLPVRDINGSLRERLRDILVFDRRNGTGYAYFGLGNQTGKDNTLPLRVIEVDAANYRRQVDRIMDQNKKSGNEAYAAKIHDNQKVLPVITTVLYFGRHWDGPRQLLDMIDLEGKDELRPRLLNHQIEIVELGKDEEMYRKFHSDFRWVVRFLSARESSADWKQYLHHTDYKIRHIDAFLDLMRTMTGDKRYEEIKEAIKQNESIQKEGEIGVCEMLDWVENTGIKIGIQQGKEEGKEQGINQVNELNIALSKCGRSDDIIRAASDKKYQKQLLKEFGLSA